MFCVNQKLVWAGCRAAEVDSSEVSDSEGDDSQQGISCQLEGAELADHSDDEGPGVGGWCAPLTREQRRLHSRALAGGDPNEVATPLRVPRCICAPLRKGEVSCAAQSRGSGVLLALGWSLIFGCEGT